MSGFDLGHSCRHRALTRGQARLTRHFSTPKPPKPPPAPAPIVDTSAADEAAARAKGEAKKKRGRAANILTSPVGAPLGNSASGGSPTLGL